MSIDILIGNDPPLYREVLAATIRALRPDLSVRSVFPEEVDSAVLEDRPWMVICSVPTSTVQEQCSSWIVLYPEDRDEAVICVAGVCRTVPGPGIRQMVDILGDLHQGSGIHPNG